MPRPKVKDYRIVPLSLSVEVLEIIDKERGSMSRTEFIEKLVLNSSKDRTELIAENEALKKELEELKKENEILKAKIRELEEKHQKEDEEVTKIYNELMFIYNETKRDFEVVNPKRAKAIAINKALSDVKRSYGVNDKVKKAVSKFLNEVGLSSLVDKVDDLLERV
mgnify:CR=1 FL=1